jgi:rhodanese-related sulfurtransferase
MSEITIKQAAALAPTVTAAEAARIVASGAILVDVRSAAGRDSSGSIPGATVVGKDEVGAKLGLDSADRLTQIQSAGTPVVVVCGSVRGSGPVAAQLIANGYTNVVQVDGGFPAWKEAGLPTEGPAPH